MFEADTMKKLTEMKPFPKLERVEFDFRYPVDHKELCTFITVNIFAYFLSNINIFRRIPPVWTGT